MNTTHRRAIGAAVSVAAALGIGLALPSAASATSRHHLRQATQASAGVRFAHRPVPGGYQALVSDGPGTGFGFHQLPAPYRFAALRARDRQSAALRDAVATDALTSGGYYGFPGDSVYGAGTNGAYGVFNGSDGYGSPYFAGYYGPGTGADYGPFGHGYD